MSETTLVERAKKLEEALLRKITPEEFLDNCEIFAANLEKYTKGNDYSGISKEFVDFIQWNDITCEKEIVLVTRALRMMYKAKNEGIAPERFINNCEIYKANYTALVHPLELNGTLGWYGGSLVNSFGFDKDFLNFCIKNHLIIEDSWGVSFPDESELPKDSLSLGLLLKMLRMLINL